MAIYHFSMKTFSRSKGQSATAAVAYRAGGKIECEREGRTHDYTRKSGVLHSEIFLPSNAPSWANNREKLWNGAESAETRKNSTVAREFEVALPCELNEQERIALVRDFAQQIVNRHGCAVDAHLHDDNSRKRQQNHHAHIMLTTRKLEKDGFTKKTRELDVKTSGEVQYWREQWEKTANKHLRNNAIENNKDHYNAIDHRTLAEQCIDRPPMKKLGVHAAALERKGIATEKGNYNREIKTYNYQEYARSNKVLDKYLVEFTNKHNFIVERLPQMLEEERHKYPALAEHLEKIGIQTQDEQKRPLERFNQKTGIELPQSTQKPLETAKNSLNKPKLSELTIEDKRRKLNSFQKIIVETAKKIHAKELQDIREQAKPMLADINQHRDNKPINPFKVKAWKQTLDKKLSDYNKLKTQHDTSQASGYSDEHKQKAYTHVYHANPAQYELAEQWQEEIKQYDKDQAMQKVMEGVQRHKELQQQNKDKEMDLDF